MKFLHGHISRHTGNLIAIVSPLVDTVDEALNPPICSEPPEVRRALEVVAIYSPSTYRREEI